METDAAVAADGAMAGVVSDGAAVDAPPGPPQPVVTVLREERPKIVTRAVPYERVTVRVDLTHSERAVTSQVRTETVDSHTQPRS